MNELKNSMIEMTEEREHNRTLILLVILERLMLRSKVYILHSLLLMSEFETRNVRLFLV